MPYMPPLPPPPPPPSDNTNKIAITNSIDTYNKNDMNYKNNDNNNKNNDTTINTKKSIRWTIDTLPGREVRCAITIIGCEKTYSAYVIYQIRCWASGRSWLIERRYSHFEKLHKDIMKDMKSKYHDDIDDLPDLPAKRWFEKQRWLNKYDDDYIQNRKQQLQIYLRQLLKNIKVSVKSKILSSFLEYELHTTGIVEDQEREGVIIEDETTRVSDIHFRPEEIRNEIEAMKIIEHLNTVAINQNIENFDKSDDEEDSDDECDDDDDNSSTNDRSSNDRSSNDQTGTAEIEP